MEPAPGMGPAGCFEDASSFIEWMQSRISIGLKSSAKALEMGLGMFSSAIGREGEPDHRRNRIGARTAVTHIGPEASCLRSSVAGCEHGNRSVVGMKSCRCAHMVPHGLDQRIEQSG
jgi:hypothetical protein